MADVILDQWTFWRFIDWAELRTRANGGLIQLTIQSTDSTVGRKQIQEPPETQGGSRWNYYRQSAENQLVLSWNFSLNQPLKWGCKNWNVGNISFVTSSQWHRRGCQEFGWLYHGTGHRKRREMPPPHPAHSWTPTPPPSPLTRSLQVVHWPIKRLQGFHSPFFLSL